MDSLSFEMETVPVCALALPELLGYYLRSRNNEPLRNPLDKRDENNTKKAITLLAECFPLTDSSQIDREALEKFQIFLVQKVGQRGKTFSRNHCNTLLKFAKSVFFWAAKQKKVPLITEARAFNISQVRALKPSPKIRENKKRKNISEEHVQDVIDHAERPVIAKMMLIESLTGMRPCEVCGIKPSLIDRHYKHGLWLYEPEQHKTAGQGKLRSFIFTQSAQEILAEYLSGDANTPIFRNRRNRPFTTATYDKAVKKIIETHGLAKLTPYQLRHNVATWADEELDLDHARAFLGHSNEKTTRIYVHNEIKKIERVAVERERALAAAVPDKPKPSPPPVILRLYTGEES